MSDVGAKMRNDLWAAAVGVPEYQCHKRVYAAKIVANLKQVEATGHMIALEGVDQGWPVSFDWLKKHQPEVGGYLVFYADGYVSYSPAKAFEDGYRKLVGDNDNAQESGQ